MTSAPSGGLTQGELFDTLCNQRRLGIIRHLRANGGASKLSPLVDYVAATENDKQPGELARAERRRVYISLYQTHLPMLEERGIVEWDRSENVISLQPSSNVEKYLGHGAESKHPWHVGYLLAGVCGIGLLLLQVLSVAPFDGLSLSWTLAVVSAAVVGVVVARYALERPPRAPITP
ncbi:hypothetical protein AUR64_01965 [Haloprofundus marisrubri]|uniref:DUF7344 domain-containing protein n=1 Tax=Haloprofundus marisrubri TaxID=1514971 RepID=A0A0W1R3L9_9EURY|nr:hypothetical protein [Haloprofundus marisrubri]KTG07819.1 hypothetical protein AUR64_01965 [Haloprofundus marisrubri]